MLLLLQSCLLLAVDLISSQEIQICKLGTNLNWDCSFTTNQWNLPTTADDTSQEGCVPYPKYDVLIKNQTVQPVGQLWYEFLTNSSERTVNAKIVSCTKLDDEPCTCEEKECQGTKEACTLVNCSSNPSLCFCKVINSRANLSMLDYQDYQPFQLIGYTSCISSRKLPTRRKRSLDLNTEPHILELRDGQVHIPFSGRLIIRKNGIQLDRQVSSNTTYHLPVEFLLTDGKIQLFLVPKDGGPLLSETYHSIGETVCKRINCLFCLEIYRQAHCLPPSIKYTFIVFLIFLTSATFIYLRTTLFVIRDIFLLLIGTIRASWILFKRLLRLGLRLGRIVGISLRIWMARMTARIDNVDAQLRWAHDNMAIIGLLVILGIGLLPSLVSGTETCNSQQVLSSDLTHCVDLGNEKQCKVTTSLETTLPNLGSTICIELVDQTEQNRHITKLALTFLSVHCTFTSEHLYYTFPTEISTQSILLCPQDPNCGWLRHCHEDKTVEPLLPFIQNPITRVGCLPVTPKFLSCFYLHSRSCLFFAKIQTPQYSLSHEVRRLSAMHCEPHLSLSVRNSSGKDIPIELRELANSSLGVSITQLGRFEDETTILFNNDKLVIEAMHPYDEINFPIVPNAAYIMTASEKGFPKPGEIGEIQATSPIARNFNFPGDSISCSLAGLDLHCKKPESPLTNLEKYNAKLPLIRGNHELKADSEGNLFSSMISSPGLRVAMQLTNLSIVINIANVCPEFDPGFETKIIGCYACSMPAQLKVRLRSSCAAGTVSITLTNVIALASSVYLEQTFKETLIQFSTDQQCPELEICLKGPAQIRSTCQQISGAICLQPPELTLDPLDHQYAIEEEPSVLSESVWTTFMRYVKNIFNFSYTTVLIIVIAVLSIFTFSCCLSFTITHRR